MGKERTNERTKDERKAERRYRVSCPRACPFRTKKKCRQAESGSSFLSDSLWAADSLWAGGGGGKGENRDQKASAYVAGLEHAVSDAPPAAQQQP